MQNFWYRDGEETRALDLCGCETLARMGLSIEKAPPCALLRPGTPAGLVLGRFLLIAAGHRRAVSARAVAHFILRDEREDVSHGPALPGGGAGPL
jgi:hypothetical protein